MMKRAYEHFTYIDRAVGRMLDEVDKRGLSGNTIVIYTADHGDALACHGGLVDKAGDLMEEVMHIPLVIRMPGVAGGLKNESLVSNMDLVPTVLEAAGLKPPSYMDGQSLVPLLKGRSASLRDDLMVQHYGHFNIHAPQRALYWKNYKYIATENDVCELYDLSTDPFEKSNAVNEPSMIKIRLELQQRLLANMDRYGDNDANVKDIRRVISLP